MFIYMTLVVLCIKRSVSAIPSYFQEDYYDIKSLLITFAGIVDIIAYLYALMGIYRTLERKPYAVAILKFSLIYVLMQLISWSSSFIATYPTWWFVAFLGGIILGGFAFLIYLFRSNKLDLYIPKKNRVFGKYGWFGMLIYLAVFILYGLYYGDYLAKDFNSQKVAVKNIKSGNLYTDGYVKFEPLADWKYDTITQDNGRFLFEFSSPIHNKITIGTTYLVCKTRLDFYEVLRNIGTPSQFSETSVEEIDYGTKELNTGILYYSTYSYLADSIKAYRTYALSVDDKSYKVAYVILDDTIWRRTSIADELLQFSQSMTFRLE